MATFGDDLRVARQVPGRSAPALQVTVGV